MRVPVAYWDRLKRVICFNGQRTRADVGNYLSQGTIPNGYLWRIISSAMAENNHFWCVIVPKAPM